MSVAPYKSLHIFEYVLNILYNVTLRYKIQRFCIEISRQLVNGSNDCLHPYICPKNDSAMYGFKHITGPYWLL